MSRLLRSDDAIVRPCGSRDYPLGDVDVTRVWRRYRQFTPDIWRRFDHKGVGPRVRRAVPVAARAATILASRPPAHASIARVSSPQSGSPATKLSHPKPEQAITNFGCLSKSVRLEALCELRRGPAVLAPPKSRNRSPCLPGAYPATEKPETLCLGLLYCGVV